MKNCIILGSGRSGTSMVAGTLAGAGYYMGDTMIAANDANPKGYYESREVETVNDNLIRTMFSLTTWERRLSRWRKPPVQPNFEDRGPYMRTHWLALIPPPRRSHPQTYELEQIERLTAADHQPYCFKDPRFCYTLPAWRPYLTDTVFICVFREPAVTATSILKEVRREPYLQGIRYTYEQALALWTFSYRHILEKHRHQGEWLFLHYRQAMTPAGLDRIEEFIEAKGDRDFPDQRLERSLGDGRVPLRTRWVYRALCRLANYSEGEA